MPDRLDRRSLALAVVGQPRGLVSEGDRLRRVRELADEGGTEFVLVAVPEGAAPEAIRRMQAGRLLPPYRFRVEPDGRVTFEEGETLWD
jgi:hypothetical protein